MTREQFEEALAVFRAEPGVTVDITLWPGDGGRPPYRLLWAEATVHAEEAPGTAARFVFLGRRWQSSVVVFTLGGDSVSVRFQLSLTLSAEEYAAAVAEHEVAQALDAHLREAEGVR